MAVYQVHSRGGGLAEGKERGREGKGCNGRGEERGKVETPPPLIPAYATGIHDPLG